MFGIWRTLLALEVVATHLISMKIFGPYAVVAFFVLSGFLMTLIMQGSYGYTQQGRWRFATNRALRLLPAHWFACAVALALIAILPAFASAYHPALTAPQTASEWLSNLTLIYPSLYPQEVFPRLSPATWALTVEIFWYALIALGLSRTKTSTLLWLSASAGYWLAALLFDVGQHAVYGSIMGGSLPFAIGAAAYHFRAELETTIGRRWETLAGLVLGRWGLCLAMLALYAFGDLDWRVRAIGNVVNALLAAGTVVYLFGTKMPWRSLDKRIGDFSYPIYLLHWPAGMIAAYFVLGEPYHGASLLGLAALAVALPVLLILSCTVVYGIDPLVETLRSKVRRQAQVARDIG